MSNEEKFKQSLKSLVESKEFVFDEKDWDKAAAYISEKRSGSKAARIGLLVLAVGLVGTSLWWFSSEASGKKENVQSAHVNAVVLSDKHESPQPNAPASLNDNTPEKTTPITTNPTGAINTPSIKNKKSVPSRSEITASSQRSHETVVSQGEMNVTFTKKNKAKQENNVSNVVPSSPVVAIGAPDTRKDKNPETNETISVSVEPVTGNKEQVADTPAENKQENVAAVETWTQATKQPEITVQAGRQEKDVPDEIKAKVPRVMLLSCEVGTSYQFGWKNEGADRDANGFNPVAGIHYMNQIDDRFSLSFGVQYQRTGHLDAFSQTSKHSRYSFGEESDVTTITPTKLHYLAIPMRLYYKLDDKNAFGASYSIAYLLDVEANIETYTLKVGKQSNNKSYTTRGYTDGFGLFDSQVALFYRRHLYGDFSLHGEVFFGLNDVKQNNFFGGDKSQRNSGLRLMLVYGIHNRTR